MGGSCKHQALIPLLPVLPMSGFSLSPISFDFAECPFPQAIPQYLAFLLIQAPKVLYAFILYTQLAIILTHFTWEAGHLSVLHLFTWH